MTERYPDDITLNTLHEDLTDLMTTLIAGFRSLPTRESSEEMVRLLRERNRQLASHGDSGEPRRSPQA